MPAIRPATTHDSATLAGLAGELGYATTTEEMEGRLKSTATDPQHAVLVAEEDGVIGWIHVALGMSLESGRLAEIRGLVVTTRARGKGVGRSLIAAAEKWTREQGCARIRVRTNVVRTETHEFYRKLGYVMKKKQMVFEKGC